MNITPKDIVNKEFKRTLRGYSVDEVDDFLTEVTDSFTELYKENTELKEKMENLNEKVEYYSNIEESIKDTLLLARNAAEQAKVSAKKEAELLLNNANNSGKKILDDAHNQVISINDEYEKVKQEFIKFRAKYRNFMKTQMETFDDMEKDFLKTYSFDNSNSSESGDINEVNDDLSDIDIKENIESIDKNDYNINNEELEQIKSFFVEDSNK